MRFIARNNFITRAPEAGIVNKAVAFAEVNGDIDRQSRGAKPEIGADELAK